MQITERKVAVRDLVNGYKDDGEKGVVGYDGRLDIRPIYQREFVYDDAQKNEVINTILRGLPLNVIYWVQKPDGNFEVLDGQQRTVSICQYVTNGFAYKPHDNSMEPKYYSNLPDDYKDRILNYELIVYVCNGTESEKLEWFKIINIAGEQLTNQELRNAVYAGSWITDAKHYFSSSTSVTNNDEFKKYLKGSPIRQEYLETALTWAASKDGETIEEYMAKNQHLPTAINLWNYFRSVTDWIKAIFPQYRKEMKGLPWGIYYNVNHERDDLDPVTLEDKVKALMEDEDVTRKSGIYEYVLDGQERVLSIRAFDMRDRRTVYEAQSGNCALCGQHCEFDEMQADHIVPWSKGGKTVASNCQMLCRDCNLKKSNK